MTFFLRSAVIFLTGLSAMLNAEFSLPYTELGAGYDYFRSSPEGDWEGNTGALASLNLSLPVPYLSDFGIGAQLGGSYGVYDWSGRLSAPSGIQTRSQQQAFITGAIYRKTFCCAGINLGLAYDWMWNKNAGVFALQSSLSQLRFQGGYLLDQCNEWGLWGTLDVHTAHRQSLGIPVSFRAISQVNLFWGHRFDNCAQTMIWAGIPYKKSLMFSSGRAGRFILGGCFRAPLTCRLSIEGHASYMRGHREQRAFKSRTYAANLYIGLIWAFSDQDYAETFLMSIGNNSNFITDTSLTY